MNRLHRLCALVSLGAALCCASCASKKKLRPMYITDVYDSTVNYYETANNELCAGQFAAARGHLASAYTLAVSIDESDLLCRIVLSGITYKVSAGGAAEQGDGSFLDSDAPTLLADAREFAGRTDRAKLLLGVCTIYDVRIALAAGGTDYATYNSLLDAAAGSLSGEPFYQGHLYRTKGDVCILQKDFSSAEAMFKKAADIHTKNRYLMEIGTDWYGVARSCSNAGKPADAVSALEKALQYDRNAENTAAIASDYYAYAKILSKGTPSEKDRASAKKYAAWSEAIFRAGGFDEQAAESARLKDSL